MSHAVIRSIAAGLSAVAGLAVLPPLAGAAVTDISQTPLISASGTPVKPNLMFILDDSGSMSYVYLPEVAGDFEGTDSQGRGKYGILASQCNGLAYDPTVTYSPAVDELGVSKGDASLSTVFSSASTSGAKNITGTVPFQTSGTMSVTLPNAFSPSLNVGDGMTIYNAADRTAWMQGSVVSYNNLTRVLMLNITSASRPVGTNSLVNPSIVASQPGVRYYYYVYGGNEGKLSFSYDSNGNVYTSGAAGAVYAECNSRVGSSPGSSWFTRADVTLANAQNYANWKAYYSTRMLMMKTVVSQAFKDIDDKFRVGYDTILNTSMSESGNSNFLSVRDFDATQKQNFYSKLFGPKNSGWTPLRASLASVGRYYAKRGTDQAANDDPIQYSCQKNFAILATDGAWNANAETTNYGPFTLASTNTNVGNQDTNAAPPFRDRGSTGSGTGNTLADVAYYYYMTDLRDTALNNCDGAITGVSVCSNNVQAAGKDTATWQHMTTYTMSLGQNGIIKYDKDYEKQTSGDYFSIVQGTKQWPAPGDGKGAENVDDLWHAAVNGRGVYFNAADPLAVANGLKTALSEITKVLASGSAAATSTLRPVAGNNQVFIARYTSASWVGDVRAYKINTDTGQPNVVPDPADANVDNADWSAAAKLKTRTTARSILFYDGAETLKSFTSSNLGTTRTALFSNVCSTTTPKLSQCAQLSTADRTAANSADNLITYLRGTEANYYRSRTSMLGDVVGSSPVYVGAPPLKYADDGYTAYQTAKSGRRPMVYVGANDGMLHALDATTGEELWAYVPGAVMANMYKLADMSYGTNHQYFVDGSPTVADIKVGSGSTAAWKTILVAGLGAGGASYFAIDITDPTNPKGMWEFTNTNLGLAFASPLITKRTDGTWSVVVTSGYNNTNGDGKGHLFMLNAATGALLVNIPTSVGSASDPSGLGPANAWIDAQSDNTALRFYAGDQKGNLWRFDTEGLVEPRNSALLLANLSQPITTVPQLAQINDHGYIANVVYVGTGRLLGLSDVGDTSQQSIYAIKDNLGSTTISNIRSTMVSEPVRAGTNGANSRAAGGNPVDWSTKNGWYVDLPDSGERINVDMLLQFNTLTAASNVPRATSSCADGETGYTWIYYFDISNGTASALKIEGTLTVGLSSFLLENGRDGVIVNTSRKGSIAETRPTPPPSPAALKRSSWRELSDR